jgi:hypothetical protein
MQSNGIAGRFSATGTRSLYSDCNAAFTVAVRTKILAALSQFPCS